MRRIFTVKDRSDTLGWCRIMRERDYHDLREIAKKANELREKQKGIIQFTFEFGQAFVSLCNALDRLEHTDKTTDSPKPDPTL